MKAFVAFWLFSLVDLSTGAKQQYAFEGYSNFGREDPGAKSPCITLLQIGQTWSQISWVVSVLDMDKCIGRSGPVYLPTRSWLAPFWHPRSSCGVHYIHTQVVYITLFLSLSLPHCYLNNLTWLVSWSLLGCLVYGDVTLPSSAVRSLLLKREDTCLSRCH